MAETYKELQKVNDSKFQQDPSTVSSKGSGFKEARESAIKINNSKPDETIDYKKANALSSVGLSLDGGVGSGLNQTSLTATASDAFDTKIFGINIGTPEAAKTVYDPFNGFNVNQEGVDVQKLASTAQSNWSKSLNLGTQFIGKTAVNLVGGTLGGFYSVGAAAVNADSSLLFDNSVTRALDEATEAIERGNTINTHREDGVVKNLFSFNTAKGLGDAASFIAGAVTSELVMQSAGNLMAGSGIATAPARWGRLLLKASQIGKPSSRIAVGLSRGLNRVEDLMPLADEALTMGSKASREAIQALDEVTAISKQLGYSIDKLRDAAIMNQNLKAGASFLRSTVTSTFWEAGLEARQAKDSFIENAMAVKNYELETDPNIDEDAKQGILAAYKEELKEYGDKVGLLTFGANAAVLKAGNVIQFPTLFGNKYVKRLNKASKSNGRVSNNGLYREANGELSTKSLKELASEGDWVSRTNFFNKLEGLGRQTGRVSSNTWKYVKNPLTEAAEEYSQYLMGETSQNYYGNVMNANVKNNPETEGVLGNLMSSFKQAMADSTKNNAWDEAIIGAIMGAVGIPMFRKGASGKREFQMEGGVWQGKKSKQAREMQNNETIRLFDTDMWNEAISSNLQKSMKSSTIAANTALSRDQAVELADQAGLTGTKEDALFNNVVDKLLDGSIEFFQADLNDLKKMSTEDFINTYINQEEVAGMTDAEKADYANKAREETLDQINTIVEAFDTVTSSNKWWTLQGNLMTDMAGNDKFKEDLLKMLTYSIIKSDIKTKQIEELSSQIISQFDGTLSEQELKDYAKLAKKFQSSFEEVNGMTEAADSVATLNKLLDSVNEALLNNKNADKTLDQIAKEIEKHSKILENIGEGYGYSGKQLTAKQIKSQSAYRKRLINKLNEVSGLIEDKKRLEQTTEQAEKSLEEIRKKTAEFNSLVEESLTDDINALTATQDGAIKHLQEDAPVVSQDVKNFIKARAHISNKLNELNRESGLSIDSFKQLAEEDTLGEKVNLLAGFEADRLMHQRVASYFYKRMDNPGALIKSMSKANLDTSLSEILKDLSLLGTYIASNDEKDVDFIEERLTAINTDFEDLEALIEGLKSREYDVLKDDKVFKEVYESAKETLEKLKADYKITTVAEENEEEAVANLNNNLPKAIPSDPLIIDEKEDDKKEVVGKDKPVSRATKANRFVLNLFGNKTNQKKDYLDAIDKGLIKSGKVVVLDSQDDSHETDDWFAATGIDKDTYNKGKELVKKDPDLIDKAFASRDEPISVESEGTTVNINGEAVGFDSKALINTISNYKDSVKGAPAIDLDAKLKELRENIQDRIDAAVKVYQGLTKGTAEYDAAVKAKSDIDAEMRDYLDKAMSVEMMGANPKDVFPELYTGSVRLESNPEAITIANTIIDQNSDVLKLVTKEQLVDLIIKNKISVSSAPTINPDIPSYSAIRYYVSNYRLYTKFTDKSYDNTNSSLEGVNYTYTSFLPAVADLESEDYLNGVALQVGEREAELNKIDSKIKELSTSGNTSDGVEIHKLNKQAIDLIAEIETLREQRSDRTNLEFRKEVLKRGPYQVKVPTINSGNIASPIREDRNPDGSFKAISEINTVKEFTLITGNPDTSLIKDTDDFIANVVYKTASKESPYKDIYGEVRVLTTSEGTTDTMEIEGVSGDMFYIYTDRTGKNIPIRLNNGTINEEVYNGYITTAIKDFFKGDKDAKQLRKELSTFLMLKTKAASKTNIMNNTVTVLTPKDEESILLFVDREGNKVEVTKDNFDDTITKDMLKEVVLNMRSNVFIGNLVDEEGVLNIDKLEVIINNNIINTDKDVANNFDKVYELDDSGEPKISVTITPSYYDTKDDKLYNPTKRSFLKSFKQTIDDNAFEISDKNIKDKLAAKTVFELATLVQQDIKNALEEAPDNIKVIHNAINNPDKLLVEDNVSKDDINTYNKYMNSIAKASIDRYFNPNNPNFRGGTIVSKMHGLIRYYPSYYTTENPDLTNTLNFALSTFEEFRKTYLKGNNINKLIEYSSSVKTRQSVIDQINKAAETPRRNTRVIINSFDKTGARKHDPSGVEIIKKYIELAATINYNKDAIIPIAIMSVNRGKDTVSVKAVRKATSIILSKDGNVVNIKYSKEADRKTGPTTYKYSFEEQKENDWLKQVRIDDASHMKDPEFFENIVLPNLTIEEMDAYMDIISRSSGRRTALIEELKREANTKDLEQSMRLNDGSSSSISKGKDSAVGGGALSTLKDVALPELKAENFTKLATVLASQMASKGLQGHIVSYFKDSIEPIKIMAYMQLYASIIKNQGDDVFSSDNIIIPTFKMKARNVMIGMNPDGPDMADIYEATIDSTAQGTFTRDKFMSSSNKDIIALRAINELFEVEQEKTPSDLLAASNSFAETVVSKVVQEHLPVEVVNEGNAGSNGLVQTPSDIGAQKAEIEGVSELFNENPELANEVYEAVGFGQSNVEEFQGFWNRQQVASQTDKVFLFGDNTNDRTVTKYVPSKTQAVIRGLSNAVGIDTKKDRGTSTTSYLTDNDFDWFKSHVDTQIQQAKNSGKTIVIPADGIGTGKAMLKEKAPKLFSYLQQELNKLKDQQITQQQKQEAQQLYSQYLDTIFPYSEVKDIVYHGTSKDFTRFTKGKQVTPKGKTKGGIWFTDSANANWVYKEENGKVIPALVNIKNPTEYNTERVFDKRFGDNLPTKELGEGQWKDIQNLLDNKKGDGLILDIFDATTSGDIGEFTKQQVVFEPEQIHILGSKQDIEGFKDWKAEHDAAIVSSESKTTTPSGKTAQTPSENTGEWFTFETKGVLEKINSLEEYKEHQFKNIKELKDMFGNEQTLNDELNNYC